MKNLKQESSIGEIVAADFRTAAVFNEYGIDFCCKGNRTITDVCEKQNLNKTELIKELELIMKEEGAETDFGSWELDRLIDYIESVHHAYVRNQVPLLQEFVNKLCSVHGSNHPELFQVRELYETGAENLMNHMMKEEKVLFPLIRNLCALKDENATVGFNGFSVNIPIRAMETEHQAEGDRFASIAEVTGNYTPPDDACTTYRVTYAMLRDFETDLHKHIHLENNILFPKAMELETAFKIIL